MKLGLKEENCNRMDLGLDTCQLVYELGIECCV